MSAINLQPPGTTRESAVSAAALGEPTRPPSDRHIARTRAILETLFGPIHLRTFAVRLWDGSLDTPVPGEESPFTLILRHPGALRRMLLPPTQRHLGEAYLNDDFDLEGDPEAGASLADIIRQQTRSPTALLRLTASVLRLPTAAATGRPDARLGGVRHTRSRDARAVRRHYDTGNDFYALWLDQRMIYSCAYFLDADDTLDAAQEAKLDLICRKLRLSHGDRLLDIGCGWGALVMHAAAHYGVDATGITLSNPQAAIARERIATAGLGDRCRVEIRDYRDIPALESFNKVSSIGMIEHVGRSRLPVYYRAVNRLLTPGGLFLNHGIVDLEPRARFPRLSAVVRHWTSFIDRHVFPDGELVSPAELIAPAESVGLETRDVESLREHYALTLRHWVRRLEAHRATATRLAGERAYRTWRLYMAGSAHAFATGKIGVVQVLFGKPDGAGRLRLPLTRQDLCGGVLENESVGDAALGKDQR